MPRFRQILDRVAPPSRGTDEAFRVPDTYVGFCDWLGVTLTPAQRVVGKIAYDGLQPKDLPPDERALARELLGDVDEIPDDARSTLVAVCGGRGGKSYALVALRLVWGMYVRDVSSAAPGQHPAALIIAPSEKLRQEVVNYAVGAIRSKPELKKTLIVPKGTADDGVVGAFSVRRPHDRKIIDFVAGVATKGGYGGRGRSWTDAVLDECAFFQDETFAVNDQTLFDAASARVLPGGQTLVTSTPWAEFGLLYTLFTENHGKPKNAIAVHAPTTLLNPADWAKKLVARAYATNPENAEREFGAKFMKGGTTIFFAPDLIDSCIDDTLSIDVPRVPLPGELVAAGGDLGFRSDSASLAITHLTATGSLILGELFELQPKLQPEGRLRPKRTIAAFKERMATHGATSLMGDQHYAETADEELWESGLTFMQCPASTDEVYVRARQKMREGVVKFARHDRLIRQLKEVQGRPLPGGKMSIVQPRWAKGGHGDNVSAFVLGLWQLMTDKIPEPAPAVGSREWEEEQKRQRYEKFRAEEERPTRQARGGGIGAQRSRSRGRIG